jgi:hypothetical protein
MKSAVVAVLVVIVRLLAAKTLVVARRQSIKAL